MTPLSAAISLDQAYAAADHFVRKRSRTFRYASALLPADQRRAMRAAYCFFRIADDMVDRAHCTPEELQAWCTQALRPAVEQTDPRLAAWADVRERYGVKAIYVRELIEGIGMDLAPRRYRTLADLKDYCYHVAATVGLLTMPIIGLRRGVTLEQAEPYATTLGIALQLTNILRDVGEDLEHGHLYLPEDVLTAFGLTAADVEARRRDERFTQVMRYLIEVTRASYAEAWPGLALLAAPGCYAVALGAVIYRALLDEIVRADFDVLNQRVSLPLWRKMAVVLRGWPAVVRPDRAARRVA